MLKAFRKAMKNTKKMIKNNKGFTLLELIIVIAIIGFLVAMVAPRLEGIGSKASGTVDDGSSKIIETTLSRYQNENNKLPNKLGNLVPDTATAGAALTEMVGDTASGNAIIWNGKKTMGKVAAFDKSFADKNKLYVHALSPAEVSELKDMGITDFVDHAGTSKPITMGTKVAMIGGGAQLPTPTGKLSDISAEDRFGDPTLAYRIMVTISDESELMTEGYLEKGSQSATQGANEKYLQNTGYNIVLPKLKSTFVRLTTFTGTWPDVDITGYVGTTDLELKEIGKNKVATGKNTTTEIIGPDNSNMRDALIISPTGVVGSGNGQSGYWEVTKVETKPAP